MLPAAAAQAIECDAAHHHVTIAKRAGIPVVIGNGEDRELLQSLGVSRAQAIAAITSDHVVNVAVAAGCRAVAPELGIVLRAANDDLASESRFLFHIGTVVNANRLAGEQLGALITTPWN